MAQLGHVELAAADNSPLMVQRYLQPLVEKDRRRLLDFATTPHVSAMDLRLIADSWNASAANRPFIR